MTVSPEQINIIREQVELGRVTSSTLQDDLVDHLCCEVENKLQSGRSFEACLSEALYELAPHGLYEIQRETNFLLSSKNLINMKKLTYLIGLLSAMAMSFGWLLRILRMGETGNAVFAFGALGFVALFLPMLGFNYFRDNAGKSWPEKLRFIFGVLSLILVGLAVLAKIMHMPGADEVLWAGGITFTFGFLPFLFFALYKKSVSATEQK